MSSLVDEAQRSLKAVNSWIGIIEGNITGSKRTAFKTSRPVFDNGSNEINAGFYQMQNQKPGASQLNLFIPNASLEIKQVTIDFKQGEVMTSNEEQHMAILGEGFFVLVETKSFAPLTKVYYSRDGEFHFDVEGFLRSADGLYVANRDYPPYDPEKASIQADIALNNDTADNYFISKTRVQQAGVLNVSPPVVGPDVDSYNNLEPTRFGLAKFQSDGGLEFSKYGSTVYQEGIASGRPEFFDSDDPAHYAVVKTYSLEAANGSITEFMPMLTVAQKAFSSISKIINVYNSTVDDMNALVR